MPSPLASQISIEVVYAEPHRVIDRRYRVDLPANLADVLRLAAADPAFAGIDIEHAAVGIFGRVADRLQALSDRDRVEIYRPLAADPKNARRARALRARASAPSKSGRS